MIAEVSEAPAVTVTEECAHLVCLRCDPNIAFCGLDVTTDEWADPHLPDCPLCVLADQAQPCCRFTAVNQ